jgi:alcohol dehydrogenase, propanol-preferring
MTAAYLPQAGPGARLTIRHDIPIPAPMEGQVLVKLTHSGICHSDVHSIYNETPMDTDIAGHEGVGHVVKLGPGVSDDFIGRRVGIKWQYSTCGKCEICPVDETACPNQDNAGRNVRGTFAQYIAAPAKDVTRLSDEKEGLSSEVLAPLLCAGLSMYSSIGKAGLKEGQWLVLPGAGGGLGHLGVQIAVSRGYKVIGVDTGEEKRRMVMGLGATAFVDFKSENVEEEVKKLTNGYGAHGVVVGAGSTAAYTEGFKLLRRLGTLVCVGLPRTDFDLPISPFWMVVRCLRVVGSSCGTRQEMEELLKMAEAGHVKPHIQVFGLEEINTIVEKLARFEIGGRVVLRIPE